MDTKYDHYNSKASSSCCAAALINLEDGWGICADCKEWAMDEETYEDMAHRAFYENEK
jgi:hypothetical protein